MSAEANVEILRDPHSTGWWLVYLNGLLKTHCRSLEEAERERSRLLAAAGHEGGPDAG
jgi:hypothetical protein